MNEVKKLPSYLTDEELLNKALSEEQEDVIPEPSNNIVAFLLFYKLEPGAFQVKITVLYRLYKAHTKDPVPKRTFINEVTNYIINKNGFFYINKNAFDIGHKTFTLFKASEKVHKYPSFNKHFQNFIKANNLEDGNIWTDNVLIHEEYKTWCKIVHRKRLLGIKSFNRFLKLYFKQGKQTGNIKYTKINRKIHEKEEKKQLEKSN
jgi:hypothetical protein